MATLERRRELLTALCAAQRDELAYFVRRFEKPISIADRGIAVVRYFRSRPLAVGALAALLAASRGRGLMKWAQRGVFVWRAWRAFAGGLR